MKLVIDTSALIAAAISRAGVCAEVMEDAITHHEVVISDFILDEITEKLREKFQFPAVEIRQLVQFLKQAAKIVEPIEIQPDLCRDPNDLPVLGTTVAGAVNLLITVDKDLLTLGKFQGIDIIKPGEFWRRTME